MKARRRLWWQQIQKHRAMTVSILVAGALGIALIVVLVLGYRLNWSWVGVNGGYNKITTTNTLHGTTTTTEQPVTKTLWDWLQLLIIPAVLAVGGYVFTYTTSRNDQAAIEKRTIDEREAAEKRAQTEREIAQDYQHQTALKEYFEKISHLLL